MHRAVLPVFVLSLLAALPLGAQEVVVPPATAPPPGPPAPLPGEAAAAGGGAADAAVRAEAPPWQTTWGLAGLRVFAAGPKVAPNGEEYHPSFSLDLDFNCWLWRSQRVYLFGDFRFWGERPEGEVTNGRDGGLGFSKRQFDLLGGPAWNYAGPWEVRVFGYSMANLNRGNDLVNPFGGNDGFGLENRYYLSPEYAHLGQTGYDVTQADFVSVGYLPTKDLVGNDGQTFTPGLLLRAYLTRTLGDWPAYVYGDATYISTRSLHPKLLLFDVGVAARPLRCWEQWELRLGAENTGDFQAHSVLNLWYASVRFVY
jgi:hypothetical protein